MISAITIGGRKPKARDYFVNFQSNFRVALVQTFKIDVLVAVFMTYIPYSMAAYQYNFRPVYRSGSTISG